MVILTAALYLMINSQEPIPPHEQVALISLNMFGDVWQKKLIEM